MQNNLTLTASQQTEMNWTKGTVQANGQTYTYCVKHFDEPFRLRHPQRPRQQARNQAGRPGGPELQPRMGRARAERRDPDGPRRHPEALQLSQQATQYYSRDFTLSPG